MKAKPFIEILLLSVLACGLPTACGEWTEPESVTFDVAGPDRQDPAAWETYTAGVRAYKQTRHWIVYACLLNAPERSTSERDFLRSLPDSLDIVSLQRTPSQADIDDLKRMHELGTQVLWPLHAGEDPAAIRALVDRHGFDGVALQVPDGAFPDPGAALAALAGLGTVVYEGDPSLIDARYYPSFTWVVLPTSAMVYQSDLEQMIDRALRAGIPAQKLLFEVVPGSSLRDYRSTKTDALTLGSRISTSLNLAGTALYDISQDYYHASGLNYSATRALITRLSLIPKTDKP